MIYTGAIDREALNGVLANADGQSPAKELHVRLTLDDGPPRVVIVTYDQGTYGASLAVPVAAAEQGEAVHDS